MQHLEVSGAVRPLKWPLGVKWLISMWNHTPLLPGLETNSYIILGAFFKRMPSFLFVNFISRLKMAFLEWANLENKIVELFRALEFDYHLKLLDFVFTILECLSHSIKWSLSVKHTLWFVLNVLFGQRVSTRYWVIIRPLHKNTDP